MLMNNQVNSIEIKRDTIHEKSGPAGIRTQDLLITSPMLYQPSHWSQVEEEHSIDNVYYLGTGKFSSVSLLELFHNNNNNNQL